MSPPPLIHTIKNIPYITIICQKSAKEEIRRRHGDSGQETAGRIAQSLSLEAQGRISSAKKGKGKLIASPANTWSKGSLLMQAGRQSRLPLPSLNNCSTIAYLSFNDRLLPTFHLSTFQLSNCPLTN